MRRSPGPGDDAERRARACLEGHGLVTLAMNYRCRAGELDLVMDDGGTVVFVEVRMRTHRTWGGAAESVDRRKQRRIAAAAQHYLQHHFPGREPPCRFDVVAFDGPAAQSRSRWIRDAFEA